MISFRTRDDVIAAFMTITAILLMAGTLVWMLLPAPTIAGLASGKARSKRELEEQIAAAKKINADLQATVDPLLWTGTAEEIGPNALASITRLAKAHSLRIVAFRPAKSVLSEGLTQVPFSVSVNGTFPQTMEFVKDLENTTSKLAVSLVQLTASDAVSDQVAGTINVVAYIKPAPVKKTAGGTSAQKPK